MNELSLSRYEDLITREERLVALIDIIYKSTEYDRYNKDLRIEKGDYILNYLSVIDGNFYERELRRKEEEYKERLSKQVNKKEEK